MQRAIELMGEFDGFASVAALAGQGRQGDGERAQGDGVIGADDALVSREAFLDLVEQAVRETPLTTMRSTSDA